jgi:hypothetical protein
MVESGSLVVLPSSNVAELRQEKFYLKARKRCLEIAGSGTGGYKRGMRIAVVSKRACSRLELEEDALHKCPGRVKVLVEALARLAAGNCSIAAAAAVALVVALVAAVAVDVAAVDVAAADVAAGAVVELVVVAVAAAGAAVVAVAEEQVWEDFVADHQMNHRTWTWTWEMGEG